MARLTSGHRVIPRHSMPPGSKTSPLTPLLCGEGDLLFSSLSPPPRLEAPPLLFSSLPPFHWGGRGRGLGRYRCRHIVKMLIVQAEANPITCAMPTLALGT